MPIKEVSNVPIDQVEDVIKVNEKAEFYILREENENGQLHTFFKRVAFKARGWVLLEQQKKNDDTIRAKISAVVKGGVVVDVYGLRGLFQPANCASREPLRRIDRHGNPDEDSGNRHQATSSF